MLKKLLTPLIEDLHKKATNSDIKSSIRIGLEFDGFSRYEAAAFVDPDKGDFVLIGVDFIKNCLLGDPTESKLKAFKWTLAHEIGHLCDPMFRILVNNKPDQIAGLFYPKTVKITESFINNPVQISLISKLFSTSAFRMKCLNWLAKITPSFMSNLFKYTPFNFIAQQSKKVLIGTKLKSMRLLLLMNLALLECKNRHLLPVIDFLQLQQ